jgi:hypothetical protein
MRWKLPRSTSSDTSAAAAGALSQRGTAGSRLAATPANSPQVVPMFATTSSSTATAPVRTP